jgi:predicted nuclease of predicted toxin-antitoxin system
VRLLLDNCLSPLVAAELAGTGHDVTWARSWGPDPGDDEILSRAARDERTLVTLDRGIGQLARASRQHSGVILITATPWTGHAHAVERAIAEHDSALRAGALVIVRPDRMRLIRPL